MFLGNFTHAIDIKGRLSIPVKFREPINVDSGGRVILATELDPCLVIYTLVEWDLLLEKIKRLPAMNPEVKEFKRFLFSRATECSLDKQGRILIPQKLRDHAGLKGDTFLIGNDNKIEIWHPERWEATEAHALEGAEAIQIELAKLGM